MQLKLELAFIGSFNNTSPHAVKQISKKKTHKNLDTVF